MAHVSFFQSWLSQNDVNCLLQGDWQLDCPRMSLRRKSKKDSDAYTGSGYIRFGKEGTLSFKMYSKQQSDVEPMPWPLDEHEQVPGKIVPREEYYILTAYDCTGRKWASRCLHPDTDASCGRKDVVLFSDLQLIECSLETPSHLGDSSSWLKFRIFDNIGIPCNAATETEIRRQGRTAATSAARDFAAFSFNGYEFELAQENNVLEFTISRKSRSMAKNFESRSIEALCFVLARHLSWTTMEASRGNMKTIAIRSQYDKPLKYGIMPPMSLSLEYAESVWNLYCCYLRFILCYRTSSKLHPISALIRSAIRSSTGAIEAQILNLAIAIEGILNKFYAKTGALSKKQQRALDEANSIIKRSKIDSSLKKRILSTIGGWKRQSASAKLRKLATVGLVTEDEFTAWKKARNPLVHGDLLKCSDLQEYVDLRSKVLTLFYKLIFNCIAYTGPYVDYATEGWPIRQFSPKCKISKGMASK